MKITVNTGANLAFSPATDRSPTARLSIGNGGGGGGALAAAAYTQANSAYEQANAAFSDSNTRVLRAGDTMTGNLNVAAWLITQNVVPSLNNFFSLGSPEYRFKDLYISGNTVYIGDAILSSEGSEVRTETFNASVSFISGGLNVLNQANSAYEEANSAASNALVAYAQANAAYTQANSAYAEANLKLNIAGGTITGSLNVDSNLAVNSDIFVVNVENRLISVNGDANVTNTISTNTVNFGFGVYDLTSNTFQTTSNALIEVDSFAAAAFSTVKYIVQVKTGTSLHSTELFCIQDGISTYLTEYATLISGAPLGSFSINLNGGRMNLNFNPDNPLNNILTFKVVRYTITS